jgi:hypothetical protein
LISSMMDSGVDGSSPGLPDSGSPDIVTKFCVDRLRESLAVSGVLFDRQLRDRAWSLTGESEALTSTAIVLIGLSRAGVPPGSVGMDLERTRAGLFGLARRRREPGALGLVLWANAVTGGPPLPEVLAHSGGPPLAEVRSMTSRFRTMELAWLLAGLAHEVHRARSRGTEEGFEAARDALIGRFEAGTRTFRHADADSPWKLRVRRWVATFADQVYPVQALAMASIASGIVRALDVAAVAAARMVDRQGARGQWWWHHDPRDGRVSGAYPVYSVHQHGMAPMALRTLAIAGGPGFSRAIEAGRSWVSDNELGVDLVDRDAGTIWRSIERDEGRPRRLARHAWTLLGRRDDRPGTPGPGLRVNHETRPYEWGWYLFARALEAGRKPPEHLA